MKISSALQPNWHNGLIGAALAAIPGLGLLITPLGQGVANLSYDLPFLFRTNVPVIDVVILYMDEQSHVQLKQQWYQQWNRSLHARLIEKLAQWGTRAVVFDVLFLDTEDNPTADAELVAAIRTNNLDVVVASKVAPKIHEGELIGWQLTEAFPALKEVAVSGIVEAAGRDKTIRLHYRNFDYRDERSLSWRAAQAVLSNALPDPFRERWVNYYGPPGTIPSSSYYIALESNSVLGPVMSNKVVFVGARYDVGFTGGKGTDDFRTPYTRRTSRRSPGVEINATTYLNLVRGDWLLRLPPFTEAALVLLSGAVFGFLLAACRPMVAAALAVSGALLVTTGAILLVWQTRFWFPWLIVVCVEIPLALGWSILIHTKRLTREKRSLEQALAMASRGEAIPAPAGAWEEPGFVPLEEQPQLMGVRIGSSARQSSMPPESDALSERPQVQPVAPAIPDHELLRCIGKGAYGEVWLARDVIGTFHAVKVVHRSAFKDSVPLEREFNGIRKFTPISRSHPGFVHILHVGRNDNAGYIYYVMEIGDDELTGQNIDPQKYSPKTLAKEVGNRGRLPLPECLEICIHLADALDYLHGQKLIHRDIKPSNIIFVKGVPKFADIGLVTGMATTDESVTYLGTPGRIAPEGPGTPASDVYSFGKVLYEVGFGLDLSRFPELPTAVITSAEDESLLRLNRIILKACELDVRHRYQTAAALRADLLDLQRRTGAPSDQL